MGGRYNIVMIYNEDCSKVLFCKRVKPPYQGKYNFPGGKVEPGEHPFQAAYRELQEETGIRRQDITQLFHLMDFGYYDTNSLLEFFVCKLRHDVTLIPEKNPLEWIDIDDADYSDTEMFGGDGNILHCVLMSNKNKELIFKENKSD